MIKRGTKIGCEVSYHTVLTDTKAKETKFKKRAQLLLLSPMAAKLHQEKLVKKRYTKLCKTLTRVLG